MNVPFLLSHLPVLLWVSQCPPEKKSDSCRVPQLEEAASEFFSERGHWETQYAWGGEVYVNVPLPVSLSRFSFSFCLCRRVASLKTKSFITVSLCRVLILHSFLRTDTIATVISSPRVSIPFVPLALSGVCKYACMHMYVHVCHSRKRKGEAC